MHPTGLPYLSFTAKREGLVNFLGTTARIGEAIESPQNIPQSPKIEYKAIWDTGATNTVITKKIVEECDLKQVSMANVQTVGGERYCPVYFVSVYLPNKVVIAQVKVTEGEIFGEADILIGMDIMNLGDYAVTNKDGKTVFTFRMPSMEVIDFVKQTASTSSTNVIPATTGDRAARRRAKFGR